MKDLPSAIIGLGVLALIVAIMFAAGTAAAALVIGGALIASFVLGGTVMWRFDHHAYYLWAGAVLIVFGLLFLFTFLYGELWALVGVVVFGTGLGMFVRHWLVAQGG